MGMGLRQWVPGRTVQPWEPCAVTVMEPAGVGTPPPSCSPLPRGGHQAWPAGVAGMAEACVRVLGGGRCGQEARRPSLFPSPFWASVLLFLQWGAQTALARGGISEAPPGAQPFTAAWPSLPPGAGSRLCGMVPSIYLFSGQLSRARRGQPR